jgi:predicted MFS family arabinose efflux permease
VGALHLCFCREVNLRKLLMVAVALGVLATLSFIGLVGATSAVVIYFLFGLLSQITHLAILDLAAQACPARAEGTVFALLMSCLNVGRTGSTFLGGWFYNHVGLTPLILVSAGFTALCWLIVPLLLPVVRNRGEGVLLKDEKEA